MENPGNLNPENLPNNQTGMGVLRSFANTMDEFVTAKYANPPDRMIDREEARDDLRAYLLTHQMVFNSFAYQNLNPHDTQTAAQDFLFAAQNIRRIEKTLQAVKDNNWDEVRMHLADDTELTRTGGDITEDGRNLKVEALERLSALI